MGRRPSPTAAPQWRKFAKLMLGIYDKMILVMRTMAIVSVTPTIRARIMTVTGLDQTLHRASAHAVMRHNELVPPPLPPSSVRANLQTRCDHTHLNGKTAFNGYGGPWGRARRCVICHYRLKWHAETSSWEEWPDKEPQPSPASSSRSRPRSSVPVNRPRAKGTPVPLRTSPPEPRSSPRTLQDIVSNPTAEELAPQPGNRMSLYEEASARLSETTPGPEDSEELVEVEVEMEGSEDQWEEDWWGDDQNI